MLHLYFLQETSNGSPVLFNWWCLPPSSILQYKVIKLRNECRRTPVQYRHGVESIEYIQANVLGPSQPKEKKGHGEMKMRRKGGKREWPYIVGIGTFTWDMNLPRGGGYIGDCLDRDSPGLWCWKEGRDPSCVWSSGIHYCVLFLRFSNSHILVVLKHLQWW